MGGMEFVAMWAVIIGATFAAFGSDKMVIFAFMFFMIGNILTGFIALDKGLLFLFLQMLLFAYTGIRGVYKLIGSKKLSIFLIGTIIFGTFLYLFRFFNQENMDFSFNTFHFTWVELIAVAFAVYGSFQLASTSLSTRRLAFGCFVVADALFVLIGLWNDWMPLVYQSFYFFLTSGFGIYSVSKAMRKEKLSGTSLPA